MGKYFLLAVLLSATFSNSWAQTGIYQLADSTRKIIDIGGCGSLPSEGIQHFWNDSLLVPDSIFMKYKQVYWNFIPGVKPWYDDTLPNGWSVCWPEVYTDGNFYIQVYRNYLVSGTGHDNPNPNSIFYIQPINPLQFIQICELLLSNKIQSTVVKNEDSLYGKHFLNFYLNVSKLGLYEVSYNSKSFLLVTKDEAEAQYYKGLCAFIRAMNKFMTDRIPMPGSELKKCYSHSLCVGGNEPVWNLPSKK